MIPGDLRPGQEEHALAWMLFARAPCALFTLSFVLDLPSTIHWLGVGRFLSEVARRVIAGGLLATLLIAVVGAWEWSRRGEIIHRPRWASLMRAALAGLAWLAFAVSYAERLATAGQGLSTAVPVLTSAAGMVLIGLASFTGYARMDPAAPLTGRRPSSGLLPMRIQQRLRSGDDVGSQRTRGNRFGVRAETEDPSDQPC
jgi:hypothetical protein